MRALFVGGPVDNSELDIEGDTPPTHYPPDTGSGQSRYARLHGGEHVGGGDFGDAPSWVEEDEQPF